MTAQANQASEFDLKDPLAQPFQDVRARLIARYRNRGDITEEQIRDAFDRAQARFADSAVRTFVPILVERIVTVELERKTHNLTNHVPLRL